MTSLQPQLLHDNEATFNTLTLKWPIDVDEQLPAQYLASRPFNIQYQYVSSAGRARGAGGARGAGAGAGAVTALSSSSDDNSSNNDEENEQHARPDDYPEQDADMTKQWWNLADYNCNENFECDIMDGLVPYTTYRVSDIEDSLRIIVKMPDERGCTR